MADRAMDIERGHLNTDNDRVRCTTGEDREIQFVSSTDDTHRIKSRLAFAIDERPPLHIAAFYGFQIITTNLPGAVTAVFIVHEAVCGGTDYEFQAQLMSSTIFMTGLASLMQLLLGSRLPITQGSSFTFFPPILAMMAADRWKCPAQIISFQNLTGTSSNASNISMIRVENEKAWKPRLAHICGGLIAASFVQFFVGVTGIVGLLMNFIGPITLAPSVMLIGLSLFPVATDACKHQWGIAFLTIALIVVFTTVLAEIKVPMITWNRKYGCHIERYPLLRMFSNFLAIGIAWLLCFILTISGALPDDRDAIGYYARTDAKLASMEKIQWFYIPYPGQFGPPAFGPDIFVGMLAATIGSILESIADYHATARICEIQAPPMHAVNRGIAMEGLASVLSGLFGTCHGTTSYSNVIGFIAYSGVASRWAWIFMSVGVMVIAIFGKLAGALATIPEPILGGLVTVGLGLVILIGMSQLLSVDLMSTRNQVAIGLALILGLMLPKLILDNPDLIKTGSDDVDSVLNVFLSTGPFVGGLVGFLLDNILPGNRVERGMAPEVSTSTNNEINPERLKKMFEFPFPTDCLKRYKIFTYVPSLPCYKERKLQCPWKRQKIVCNNVQPDEQNRKQDEINQDSSPQSYQTSL